MTKSSESVLLATGSHDQTIKLWDTQNQKIAKTFQHLKSQINSLTFSPDGRYLYSAGFEKIRSYDIEGTSNNPVITLEGIKKNVTGFQIESEGRWMVSCEESGSAKIWDNRENCLTSCSCINVKDTIFNCLSIHPNQVSVVLGEHSSFITVWDLRTNKYIKVPTLPSENLIITGDHSITSLSFDYGGTTLVMGDNEGRCIRWRLNDPLNYSKSLTDEFCTSFAAHDVCITSCHVTPDSRIFSTSSADGTTKLWNNSDCSHVYTLSAKLDHWVWDAQFTEDSQYIFTGSSDGYCRFWSVNTGENLIELACHIKPITAIALFDVII